MSQLLDTAKQNVGTVIETDPFSIDDEHRKTFEHGSYLTEMYGQDVNELGYPDGLIEGFHILSLLDPVTHGKIDFGEGVVAWNYGLNKVRFVRPAMIDVPYRCRLEVLDASEKGDGVQLETKAEILDEEGELIMFAEWLSYLAPPPSD